MSERPNPHGQRNGSDDDGLPTEGWQEPAKPAAVEPEQPASGEVAVRARGYADGTVRRDESVEIALSNLEQQADAAPGYQMAAGLLRLVRENLARTPEGPLKQTAELIRQNLTDDVLSPDFWHGLGTVLRYQVDERVEFIRRRQRGAYTTDPYGFDPEVLEAALPFARFLYRSWWRVETIGMEHIPATGHALLVSNHSGVLPFDGMMIVTSVLEEHPERRLVRSLFNDWFATVPFLAPLLTSLGQVQALPENAVRLLGEGELVCVFPEGYKGVGKPFKDRYKLGRFGRGGYVQAALRASAPLIPMAVVGAEETYPLLGNIELMAKLIGAPFFPITPFFPWLGPLGTIPLPTKWWIEFGPPLATASYGPEAADDPLTVAEISDQVRGAVQAMIDARLAKRASVFFG